MRDIEEMNNEIASSKLATEHYKAQIASNASRWAIRDRLAQDKSTLQEIQPQQIESIHAPTNQPTMASK